MFNKKKTADATSKKAAPKTGAGRSKDEDQVQTHNRLAAEARRAAGIKAVGCNAGLSDRGQDRVRGN